MTARLVVLVSGNGSNLQALLDAIGAGGLEAEVVAVFSNRVDAHGLERARLAGVPAVVVESDGPDRRSYDRRLTAEVGRFAPDIVVLAGWMRILTLPFLASFRVLNLHPAKPGCFPGTRAIERAYDAWRAGQIEESGVMVHWVPDEGIDSGPVIEWEAVAFEDGDSLESFEARMHRTEHRLLVSAVALALAGTPADPAAPQPKAVSP